MQYAHRYPERIDRLIIASAHPGLMSEEAKKKRHNEDAKWAEKLLHLPIDEFLKHWYDQSVFAGFCPDFSLRRNQNKPDLVQALMHYSLANQPLLHIEKAMHVVGERDLKYRAIHPNAIVIPNAGHAIHLENPKAFANCIQEII